MKKERAFSIVFKIILGIILPAALIFVGAGWLILNKVSDSVLELSFDEMAAQSSAASYQVSEFFTSYIGVVEQMATNYQIERLMGEVTKGSDARSAASYGDVAKTLDQILAYDSNLSLVWLVDLDSGDTIRSKDVVRGLPDYDITQRGWYHQLMEHKSLFLTAPYIDSSSGALVTSIMQPVNRSGSMLGAVAIDLTIDELGAMMARHKLGDTGFFVLATQEGNVVYHPDESLVGAHASELGLSTEFERAVANAAEGNYKFSRQERAYYGSLTKVGSTGWMVIGVVPEDDFVGVINDVKRELIITFALGLCILVAFSLLITIGIVRPIRKLAAAANRIGQGDLNVMIDVKNKDETGQAAQGLRQTVTRLQSYIAYIEEISQVLHQFSQGNLLFELKQDYAGEFARVKEALLDIQTNMSETFRQINMTAQQVNTGASQISAGAVSLSQGSEQQSVAVSQLKDAVDDVSQQVIANAADSQKANIGTVESSKRIEECSQQMDEMKEAMDQIAKSSEEIGNIIKTIDNIAFQTNILALNAAVEAARAGVHGKGFAVVADEVRNLSTRSAEAAHTTTELVERSLRSIQEGVSIAERATISLSGVVEMTQEVSGLVAGISDSTRLQEKAVVGIQTNLEEIANVVQTNAGMAEESAASSQELMAQSTNLFQMITRFRYQQEDKNPASSRPSLKPDSFSL